MMINIILRRGRIPKIMILTMLSITSFCCLAFSQEAQKNGLYVTYYDSGQVRTEESFKDGRRHGIMKLYSERGRLIQSVRYENGKYIGIVSSPIKHKLGPLKFLLDIRFWIGIFIGGGILWFLFVQVSFKDRPF